MIRYRVTFFNINHPMGFNPEDIYGPHVGQFRRLSRFTHICPVQEEIIEINIPKIDDDLITGLTKKVVEEHNRKWCRYGRCDYVVADIERWEVEILERIETK